MGIQGIVRGKPTVRRSRRKGALPGGQGERPVPRASADRAAGVGFHPCRNLEWVRLCGVDARKIIGWPVSTPRHAGFVPDVLERAVHDRRPGKGMGLVYPSDRGSRSQTHFSITRTERLAEAGIEPSVARVGDSYDNALAETINGLFEAEDIHRRGPWHDFEAVGYASLERLDWFDNRRLLEPIGNTPPAEAEANFPAAPETEPVIG